MKLEKERVRRAEEARLEEEERQQKASNQVGGLRTSFCQRIHTPSQQDLWCCLPDNKGILAKF
jgi:hypothetical protein